MKMTDLESPFTGGLVEEVVETRTYELRGQQVTIDAVIYRCVDTGELFSTGEQDEAILVKMQQQWRERNRVPAPAALTARRVQLGISAREASKLLGFGVNQFNQYEAGELPSESNMLLLRFFCDPQMLRRLLSERMDVLPAKAIRKLQGACSSARVSSGTLATVALSAQSWGGPGSGEYQHVEFEADGPISGFYSQSHGKHTAVSPDYELQGF